MAQVTRTHVYIDGETLTAALLNNEFNNLLNALALTNADVASNAAINESKILFSATGHGHTGGADGKTITVPPLTPPNGWVSSTTDTWTYNSVSGIISVVNVASGAGSVYDVGDKVRLKQGAGYLYFYVTAVTDTTLSLTGGTDYTLANSAITDNWYSKVTTPESFPHTFNYTPTFTGFSANPTGDYRFRVIGRICQVHLYQTGSGTSNSTAKTFTLPITPANISGMSWGALCNVSDNGTQQVGKIVVGPNSTVATVYATVPSPGNWTASGACVLENLGTTLTYEI